MACNVVSVEHLEKLACTSILYRVCYDPPPMNTPAREGETIEGSRTIHAESTLSSAQVLKGR